MPSMTTSNGMFLLEHTIDAIGDKNIQLTTTNKFIDQDILVKITTPAASDFSLDISNNTTDNVTIGSLNTTTNKYPVTATVGGTFTAATPGWFSTGSDSETGVQVGLIPKASFTTTGGVFSCNSPGYITSGDLQSIATVTPSASIDTGTSSNYNGMTTYFTKQTSSSGASVTIKPQYSTSAGYVTAATNSITTGNITYWKIKTASPTFKAAPTGNSTADFTNITYSTTDNGIAVQTAYTIDAVPIQYAAAVSAGWLTAKSASANTGQSTTAKTSTNGNIYYITGVTVPSGTTFNAKAKANNAGTITVAAYASNSDSNTPSAQVVVEGGVWKTFSKNPTSSAQGPFYGKTSITAVSQTNLSEANIKSGVTITIKGGTNNIWSKTGTFTSASTVSSGQTAVTYNSNKLSSQILTGYSAWVDGYEIKGNMQTVSVIQNDWTKDSSNVVTANTASWDTGMITNGFVQAVVFGSTPAAGVNDSTYIDISNGLIGGNNIVPEIPTGGFLYINKGYIGNVKISLSRLVPDASAVNNLAAVHILSGHSAYDNAGNLIVGSISQKTAYTYYPSTSDQSIAAGQYLSGAQTFKAVKLTNISADKIKKDVVIKVGDADDDDRITTVTGTYTTVTGTGITALTAAALRTGYAGFANGGSQINGSMPDVTDVTPIATIDNIGTYFNNGSASSYSIKITPSYTNATAGYLAAHSAANTDNSTVVYKTIKTAVFTGNSGSVELVADTTSNSIYKSTTNTGNVSIESSAPATDSGYLYVKLTGSGTVKASTAGWITANAVAKNSSNSNATGSGTRYLKILKYDGSYTIT